MSGAPWSDWLTGTDWDWLTDWLAQSDPDPETGWLSPRLAQPEPETETDRLSETSAGYMGTDQTGMRALQISLHLNPSRGETFTRPGEIMQNGGSGRVVTPFRSLQFVLQGVDLDRTHFSNYKWNSLSLRLRIMGQFFFLHNLNFLTLHTATQFCRFCCHFCTVINARNLKLIQTKSNHNDSIPLRQCSGIKPDIFFFLNVF